MDLKKLFDSSKKIIHELYPASIDVRLEEAEEQDDSYHVVVSYLVEDQNKPTITSPLSAISMMQNQRDYERVFKELSFTKEFEFKKFAIFKS